MSASLVLQRPFDPGPGARLAGRPRGARRGGGGRRRRATGRAAGRRDRRSSRRPWARTGSSCAPPRAPRPSSRRWPARGSGSPTTSTPCSTPSGTTTSSVRSSAARPRLRILGHPDGFEAAVTTVLGQQVSLAAARTFGGRLAAAYGSPGPGGLTVYPTPERLAAVDPVELQGVVRITHSRARTLHALARACADGLDLRRAPGRPRRPARPARDRSVDRGLPGAARARRPRRDARGRPRPAPGPRRGVGGGRHPTGAAVATAARLRGGAPVGVGRVRPLSSANAVR